MARPRRHVSYVVRPEAPGLWWSRGRWRPLADVVAGSSVARAWTARAALRKAYAGHCVDPAVDWTIERTFYKRGERWSREFVLEAERG